MKTALLAHHKVVVAGKEGRLGLMGDEVRDGVGVRSSSIIIWDAPEEDDVVE